MTFSVLIFSVTLALVVSNAYGCAQEPQPKAVNPLLGNLKVDACYSGWSPMGTFYPSNFVDGRNWFVVFAPFYDNGIVCTTWNFAPRSGTDLDYITLVRTYTYADGHKSPNGDSLTKRWFHNAEYDYDANNARLTILNTDYNTWGLVEICNATSHFPLILSRQPALPSNYVQLIGQIQAYGYDTSQLKQQTFTGC